MALDFACPSCGQMLEAPDSAAGAVGACKFCKARLIAPAAPGMAAQLAPDAGPSVPGGPGVGASGLGGSGLDGPQHSPPPPGGPGIGGPSTPGGPATGPGPYTGSTGPGPTPPPFGGYGAGMPPPGGYVPYTAPQYADMLTRFAAWVVDLILLSIVGYIIRIAFGGGAAITSFNDPSAATVSAGQSVAGLINFVIYVAYYAVLESSPKQGSFGKQLLGLKVVDNAGNRLTMPKAIIRSLVRFVSFCLCCLGFSVAFFTPDKQALHDLAAGTYVVKA